MVKVRFQKRIQRKGFFDYSWKEKNGIYVGRPSRWGNPFKVADYGLNEALRKYCVWLRKKLKENPAFLDPLKGKTLVCFCPLDQKYHADILAAALAKRGSKRVK